MDLLPVYASSLAWLHVHQSPPSLLAESNMAFIFVFTSALDLGVYLPCRAGF